MTKQIAKHTKNSILISLDIHQFNIYTNAYTDSMKGKKKEKPVYPKVIYYF